MDADKKKAEEIIEAIKKAREAEFNLGNKEFSTKTIGQLAFTEEELALIGIAVLEKIDTMLLVSPKNEKELVDVLIQLPQLDYISKKISKILNVV